MKAVMCIIYITVICLANYSVHIFGPATTPLNAFIFIGLDMVLRDKLHERVGIINMLLLVAVAGVISFVINPAINMIAVASVAAFAISACIDAAMYQVLINKPWLVKANGSNVAASFADSVIFPLIAFGAFMPWIVLGQFAAKVLGGGVWSWVLRSVK